MVKLVRDYRSTPQVVGCANAVMAVAGASSLKLVAQRPDGPQVSFAEASDEASEAAGIADWVEAQHAAGVDYRDIAVLFRINAQSPPLEQALAERRIPYLVRSGERFYERPEVRQTLVTLRTQLRAADPYGGEGGSALEQLKALLGALGWTERPPEGAGAVRERWESLAALLSVAEDLATERTAAGATLTLAEVSAELDRRAEAQHVPTAQGVTVSTLHSAKGLEWDAVALLGVHEGSLPFVLATTPEEVTEERRLLYVGMTRAERLLRVSWSRTRNGGGNARRPSRFLDPVLPASMRTATAGPGTGVRKGRGRGAVLSVHCRSCGRGLNDAAERKLGRHQDCPATFDEATLDLLREWRRQEAASASLPAYCVFTDATLVAIAEARPSSDADLFRVQGLGKVKVDKYGDQVLAVLAAGEERARAAS